MTINPVFFLEETTVYNGPEPYFYDSSQVEAVKIIEENWHIIYDEFSDLMADQKEIVLNIPYPPGISRPNAWKITYFFNFMWQYHSNCNRYPKTYALLKSIPSLTFAAVTALAPKASVLPHIGETNVTMRGHLGLKIPAPYPEMGLRVGNEEKGWEQGKVILFSDCHWHTAWNDSDEERFVLVFDIIRPEFIKQKLWMSARGLSAISIKMANEKWGMFKPFPNVLVIGLHYLLASAWFLYLPFQRRFRLP
jgi:aspartyl/asparaginyl beta-hydroxylase (cupin superfamily)